MYTKRVCDAGTLKHTFFIQDFFIETHKMSSRRCDKEVPDGVCPCEHFQEDDPRVRSFLSSPLLKLQL